MNSMPEPARRASQTTEDVAHDIHGTTTGDNNNMKRSKMCPTTVTNKINRSYNIPHEKKNTEL